MILEMDADLLQQARSVDTEVLGQRIRSARRERGLTQTEVAGAEMSTGYVSRIESGQRRPDPDLLEVIARRLGTDVSALVTGTPRDVVAEQRLGLDWAELSLRTGDPRAALAGADAVLAQDPPAELRRSVQRTRAAALEALGDLESAIITWEDVVADGPHDLGWLVAMTNLSRVHRVSADLPRAIATGEEAAAELEALGLAGTDEASRLTMTLAAAYFERGDTGHATRMCRRAIETAEDTLSPSAKVAVYWNASVMESRRGNAPAALALAHKALAILELGEDHLQLSRLRTQIGIMKLRSGEPDLDTTLDDLRLAERDLATSEAARAELVTNRVAQARAQLHRGELQASRDLLDAVLASPGTAPLVTADAQVLLGQIHHAEGDVAAAHELYSTAVLTLSMAGADTTAAKAWFELGGLLEAAGDQAAALDAFRRAAASTGITAMNVPVQIETLARAARSAAER